ncbi:MAG: N-acetyltransferase [Porcipelethomonas sp.]
MIRRLEDEGLINYEMLMQSCCGRRILAYLDAYGTAYDFCRFYISGDSGVILIINSTMIISGNDFDPEELRSFAEMNMPFRIEGSSAALDMIKDLDSYQMLHRTMFQLVGGGSSDIDENDINFSPSLDSVYEILQEGFPNLTDYPLWLTDTSHRVRRGISSILTYKETTTASLVYDINGYVLVGQVATKAASRGNGYARKFLKWLADYLESHGKISYLYALDVRESFYREIGFKVADSQYVLERMGDDRESEMKGKLQ